MPNSSVQDRLKIHHQHSAPNNMPPPLMSIPFNQQLNNLLTPTPTLNTLNPLLPMANIGLLNSNAIATLNNNNSILENNNQNMLASMANQLGGVRLPINMDLLPAIAGKIFEQINAVQKNFENKYDMKVQKEISEMQVNHIGFFQFYIFFVVKRSEREKQVKQFFLAY